jgi:AcrR family transcriptional regulator
MECVMARPALHSTDVILDAARDALLREGPRGATIQAISAASGAPTGTLYHRFGNRDRLLIEAWLRAVRRFQDGFLAALEGQESLDAAIAGALWTPHFVRTHEADARLLLAFRQADLADAPLPDDLRAQCEGLNAHTKRAVSGLAGALYGRARATEVERVMLGVVDLPLGTVRRHLERGARLPRTLEPQLEAAVRAALA